MKYSVLWQYTYVKPWHMQDLDRTYMALRSEQWLLFPYACPSMMYTLPALYISCKPVAKNRLHRYICMYPWLLHCQVACWEYGNYAHPKNSNMQCPIFGDSMVENKLKENVCIVCAWRRRKRGVVWVVTVRTPVCMRKSRCGRKGCTFQFEWARS